MSKAKAIGGLLLAATVAVLGGVMEKFIGFSPAVTSGIVTILALLSAYPAVRRWGGASRALTFKRWALGSIVASITMIAILIIVC